MSILELENITCSGCGGANVGVMAEFNHKLLCTECFRKQITQYVEQAASASS